MAEKQANNHTGNKTKLCSNSSCGIIYIHIFIGELHRCMCTVKFHGGKEHQKCMSNILVMLDVILQHPLVSLMKMLKF